MGYSREYYTLRKRIKKLKSKYDYNENLNGPTPDQMDDLRAFLLLSHAEFEYYFETMARKILMKAEKEWHKKHVANYNLSCIFIYGEKARNHEDIATTIGRIISNYKNNITQNNGIKKTNILNLYGPLGYEEDDFETTFLADLNTVGEKRGNFAHLSFKTVQITSKNDIFALTDRIVTNIEKFEDVLKSKEKRFA